MRLTRGSVLINTMAARAATLTVPGLGFRYLFTITSGEYSHRKPMSGKESTHVLASIDNYACRTRRS